MSACAEQEGAQLLLSSEQDEEASRFGQSSIEDILEHYSEETGAAEGGAEGGGGKGKAGDAPRAKSAFSQAMRSPPISL